MSDLRAISLRYGSDHLACTVPTDADLLEVREPVVSISHASFRTEVHQLLDPMPSSGPIAIVVADKTRLCDYPTILSWLIEALVEHGADRSRILFYIAYGNHVRQSEAESQAAYGPIYAAYPFIHHRSSEPTRFVELGQTRRSTPVRVREDLLGAGLIITVGAISHHYFAGFGGGRKLLFPGLGEQKAIYANHRLFLDQQDATLARACRPGRLKDNPLAEDLAEIHQLLPPYRSIHGLLDSRGAVAALRFGRSYEDFLAACAAHDVCFRVNSDKRYDLVLASAGGFPKDINFIQSHKAIDNASAFVRDGGTLILLAECGDGIGSDTFLPYFAMGGRPAAFARLATNYSGNGGTALAMMVKTERIRIALVTALDDDICRRIGIRRIGLDEATCMTKAAPEVAVIANASMLVRCLDETLAATM